MMYSPADLNFGATNTAGASNPAASYLQSQGSVGLDWSGNSAVRPGAAAPGGMGGLGFNMDTAKLALGGLQTIGSLWQAWEANKLAKDQFKFQKDFANTNLANSIQSYNTTLEDRGRTRAFAESQDPAMAQAYLDKNRLPARSI